MPHKNKKKKHAKSASHHLPKEKDPEYMVQIADPAMLRKDILESLREIILFMQGYEKFRSVQEQKVATIVALKEDVKEIKSLIDHKLKKYLPKGKLRVISKAERSEENESEISIHEELPAIEQSEELEQPKMSPPLVQRVEKSDDIAELESQLKEIEGQLRTLK